MASWRYTINMGYYAYRAMFTAALQTTALRNWPKSPQLPQQVQELREQIWKYRP
jgi:hypothetical protein